MLQKILMVRQNYFSDLYPAKILDLSAKSFFSCASIFLRYKYIGTFAISYF